MEKQQKKTRLEAQGKKIKIFMMFCMAIFLINLGSSAVWNSSYERNLTNHFPMENDLSDLINSESFSQVIGTSIFNLSAGINNKGVFIDESNKIIFTGTTSLGHSVQSINFWINNVGTTAGKVFARFGDASTGYIQEDAGKYHWFTFCGNAKGTASVTEGKHMITVKKNATNTYCYVDGVLDSAGTPAFNFTMIAFPWQSANAGDKEYVDEILNYPGRDLSNFEISELYNAGNGIFPIPEANFLLIDLTYPTNNSLSTLTNQTFNATYSYSLINITNATYYIWNPNSSIFNKTTVAVSSSLNTSSLFVNNFNLGSYKWNVYACGTNSSSTICNWSKFGNYSIDFSGSIVSEIYSNITTETSTEIFQANFSLFPGSNVISVNLIYNGNSYIVSDITNYGTIVELKRTIDIPLLTNAFANETKQFYWNFIFSNGGLIPYNTSSRNQTVNPLNIVYCNSTFNMVSINFTTYNELNPNPKINATFHTAWDFWSGSGAIKKTYAFEDTSLGNSSFKFCISPNSSTIYANLNSEITSTGFQPRTYYLANATLNNITREIPLRLINETSGVKFFHTIRDSVTRVEYANVIISKYDVGLGQWVVVGIRQSDIEGEFIEYLELDKSYSYAITKNGEFLGVINRTSTCQASPCTIDLEISDTKTNFWTGYYDVFAPSVVYNLSYSPTTKLVTYNFVDTSGLATYFRLQVNLLSSNQTGELVCNNTLYATVGSLTCNMTGQSGNFVAKGYVARSPEKIVSILYGILDALAEIIGKDDGLLFTFLLVVIVGLIGAWNPAVGIILAGLAFIFASIMGLIMISFTSIVLVVLLVIILVIKMGRNGV